MKYGKELDTDQKKHLRTKFISGSELVPNSARLCIMNLYLDEFVICYNPKNPHRRKATWTEETPDGRWRCYEYDELLKRDKANLAIFWLRDETLEESDNLPDPEILAQEIVDDLQTALEQFANIAAGLRE